METNQNLTRPVEYTDSEIICELSNNELGYNCDELLVREKILHLDKNREEVFVAIHKDAVVGFIHIEKYEPLFAPTMANILGLAVSKEFQHMGFGSILLKIAEKWAADNGCTSVRVNSGAARTNAHKFYRAMGYLNEKDQKRFLKKI